MRCPKRANEYSKIPQGTKDTNEYGDANIGAQVKPQVTLLLNMDAMIKSRWRTVELER